MSGNLVSRGTDSTPEIKKEGKRKQSIRKTTKLVDSTKES
jgi:hypothetical protein